MMVFMPLVSNWIGQFCRDVIGHQIVKGHQIAISETSHKRPFHQYFLLMPLCDHLLQMPDSTPRGGHIQWLFSLPCDL